MRDVCGTFCAWWGGGEISEMARAEEIARMSQRPPPPGVGVGPWRPIRSVGEGEKVG